MKVSDFRVIGDNVLLEVIFEEKRTHTPAGIIIPDTIEEESERCLDAIVRGIGPKVDTDDININDKVKFLNFGVHPVDIEFDDDPLGVYCLLKEINICMVID